MLLPYLYFILLGIVAGFLAGLLGVGGGIVIVPSLYLIFSMTHVSEVHILHLALGTSLACIMFTSVSSFRAHHFHGAVNWPIFRAISPGIIMGTLLGTFISAHLNTQILKYLFAIFLLYSATLMIFEIQPRSIRNLPNKRGMFVAGNLIGMISSLIGIGGGTLSVPFMLRCDVKIHQAIGTSAAIGFPIAIAGTVGYFANGINMSDLPPYTLGYLNLPAIFGIVPFSLITAPLGVKVSHRIPVGRLKKIFAILLFILAFRMFLTMI